MKRIVLSVIILAGTLAYASGVFCPVHDYAPCYFTGSVKLDGSHQFQEYHCTCGDTVWVKVY